MKLIKWMTLLFVVLIAGKLQAQQSNSPVSRKISPNLFGIFFEDISYAADGGLYAELIQNRSFEYSPADQKTWNSLTAWEYTTDGYGYGTISVETASPLNKNNLHYVSLNVEEPGKNGVGITNTGYDGISIATGRQYNFSVFIRQESAEAIPMKVFLQTKDGDICGEAAFSTNTTDWKKYSTTFTATRTADSVRLVLLATSKAKLSIDMLSLFPQNTFKNRPNGMRADLAQAIADIHPKFMRFPGGCLVHGDGLGNMYRWKNTIGPLEARLDQRNIWNYHQSNGLGYYEYFQFCEDIGAKPVPVVPAAVSCQNSGGTWRIGGTGQRELPKEEMKDYIQEVLDLVEYANGSPETKWGAKRAAAGHPESFHLEYIGIGNEDKQTFAFRERFEMIYDAVKAKHPEITIIGTVGPAPDGTDFEQGWTFADMKKIAMVDEHYYETPQWFLNHNNRYDSYDRSKSKVYLGEYASQGNSLFNALAEAAYMTALERNGDLVKMASYAPLLARQNHTSWNPNLIYFNNNAIALTPNYYVQQLFSLNQGDTYYGGVVSFGGRNYSDTLHVASCVVDSKTGDVILKLVNAGDQDIIANADLKRFGSLSSRAKLQVLTGDPAASNTLEDPAKVLPVSSEINTVGYSTFTYRLKAYSLAVVRIKKK